MKLISMLFLIFSFFIVGCNQKSQPTLKISTTSWIGYTPLLYAKQKGWLEPLNIKLINLVSLSENMYLYQAGNSDALTSTQYEYTQLKENQKSLMPIMLFDRSNGGDIIMSNTDISNIKNYQKKIKVYMEVDSINQTIFNDFMSKYNLSDKNFIYINEDQASISTLQDNNKNIPKIIVTYTPYNFILQKQGFHKILSTKDNLNIIVIDAMFTSDKVLLEHQEQFKKLKKITDKAIGILQHNPKEFYETVKPYLGNQSFHEFNESLGYIEWINKDISNKLKKRLNDSKIPIKDLIK